MNMQDNELDDLFRSKLSGLEVKPAAKVWANIASELNGNQEKKLWAPFFSIAATVLVVLAAGTWFLTTKPVEQNKVVKRPVKVKVAKTFEAIKPNTTEPVIATPVQVAQTHIKPVVKQIAYAKLVKPVKATVVNTTINTEDKATIDAPPATIQQAPVLAAVPHNTVVAVVPDMSLTAISATNNEPVLKAVIPVTAMAAQPEKVVKKRGIRSLGGLINAVIAKVDKREDKLIEFTESDEDQSNVTGINLGIIKIKKDK